jgi:hypothetical protein
MPWLSISTNTHFPQQALFPTTYTTFIIIIIFCCCCCCLFVCLLTERIKDGTTRVGTIPGIPVGGNGNAMFLTGCQSTNLSLQGGGTVLGHLLQQQRSRHARIAFGNQHANTSGHDNDNDDNDNNDEILSLLLLLLNCGGGGGCSSVGDWRSRRE